MSRRAARLDANHGAIVQALEEAGASVQSLAALGRGVPDLLVWHPARGYAILECKDGSKPPSKRGLTADQKVWIALWRGPVYVVDSPEQALRAIGAIA